MVTRAPSLSLLATLLMPCAPQCTFPQAVHLKRPASRLTASGHPFHTFTTPRRLCAPTSSASWIVSEACIEQYRTASSPSTPSTWCAAQDIPRYTPPNSLLCTLKPLTPRPPIPFVLLLLLLLPPGGVRVLREGREWRLELVGAWPVRGLCWAA